ncbi:epoxide hydrolase family protein [Saccharopolyspora sp. 5N708]|uniref:epoxide hydrolase family protein n=1 Tax=Saccharopolyspora sp. 5N708 TaxID=3457424 RepID=UPI003FD47671
MFGAMGMERSRTAPPTSCWLPAGTSAMRLNLHIQASTLGSVDTRAGKLEERGEISPFWIDIAQSELDDLYHRLDRTRWPDELPGVGWTYGIPLGYVKELAAYWRNRYDWRAQEALLNSFPQFTTTIDGQNVHFLHVRSAEENAIPLVLTHGWPGSVVEFLQVIGPLTDPVAHGGQADEAFHVVVPSMPGYGFSGLTTETGWDLERIALAWDELMRRLGYRKYGAQGGDWGSNISIELAAAHPDQVLGVHVNMLVTGPSGAPEHPSVQEQRRLAARKRFDQELSGYLRLQATRPQTVGFGLADSPVGQLAWIAEKFKDWTDSTNLPEDAVDRDQLLTNVMLYWLTNTGASSARLYHESSSWLRGRLTRVDRPMAVAVFAKDIHQPDRSVAETYNNIVRWTEFDRGGHFAAMEQPDLLVGDVRAFFARFR